MDTFEKYSRVILIVLLLGVIVRLVYQDNYVRRYWEFDTDRTEVLRSLSRTCNIVFSGVYVLKETTDGWRIRCDYQEGEG